eukprot:Lankesteria_metandrocarpae@DN3321_c0_g1_i1.p1
MFFTSSSLNKTTHSSGGHSLAVPVDTVPYCNVEIAVAINSAVYFGGEVLRACVRTASATCRSVKAEENTPSVFESPSVPSVSSRKTISVSKANLDFLTFRFYTVVTPTGSHAVSTTKSLLSAYHKVNHCPEKCSAVAAELNSAVLDRAYKYSTATATTTTAAESNNGSADLDEQNGFQHIGSTSNTTGFTTAAQNVFEEQALAASDEAFNEYFSGRIIIARSEGRVVSCASGMSTPSCTADIDLPPKDEIDELAYSIHCRLPPFLPPTYHGANFRIDHQLCLFGQKRLSQHTMTTSAAADPPPTRSLSSASLATALTANDRSSSSAVDRRTKNNTTPTMASDDLLLKYGSGPVSAARGAFKIVLPVTILGPSRPEWPVIPLLHPSSIIFTHVRRESQDDRGAASLRTNPCHQGYYQQLSKQHHRYSREPSAGAAEVTAYTAGELSAESTSGTGMLDNMLSRDYNDIASHVAYDVPNSSTARHQHDCSVLGYIPGWLQYDVQLRSVQRLGKTGRFNSAAPTYKYDSTTGTAKGRLSLGGAAGVDISSKGGGDAVDATSGNKPLHCNHINSRNLRTYEWNLEVDVLPQHNPTADYESWIPNTTTYVPRPAVQDTIDLWAASGSGSPWAKEAVLNEESLRTIRRRVYRRDRMRIGISTSEAAQSRKALLNRAEMIISKWLRPVPSTDPVSSCAQVSAPTTTGGTNYCATTTTRSSAGDVNANGNPSNSAAVPGNSTTGSIRAGVEGMRSETSESSGGSDEVALYSPNEMHNNIELYDLLSAQMPEHAASSLLPELLPSIQTDNCSSSDVDSIPVTPAEPQLDKQQRKSDNGNTSGTMAGSGGSAIDLMNGVRERKSSEGDSGSDDSWNDSDLESDSSLIDKFFGPLRAPTPNTYEGGAGCVSSGEESDQGGGRSVGAVGEDYGDDDCSVSQLHHDDTDALYVPHETFRVCSAGRVIAFVEIPGTYRQRVALPTPSNAASSSTVAAQWGLVVAGGSSIIIKVEFDKGDSACYEVHGVISRDETLKVASETDQRDLPPVHTTQICEHREVCAHSASSTFSLNIPQFATPSFSTDAFEVSYKVTLKFYCVAVNGELQTLKEAWDYHRQDDAQSSNRPISRHFANIFKKMNKKKRLAELLWDIPVIVRQKRPPRPGVMDVAAPIPALLTLGQSRPADMWSGDLARRTRRNFVV